MTTTLLAVDDSKTMRKVIEITFASEDFRVLVCANAEEALAKLSERPSVALVDAGLDGYELCRRLKAAQPGLGVVLLSNKQQPYDRTLGGQVGADDFADKPFDTQQLIDKVNALAKKLAGAGAPAPAPAAAPQPTAAAPTAPRAAPLQYGTPSAPAAAPAPPPPRQQPGSVIPAGPAGFPSRAPVAAVASAAPEVARSASPAAAVASASPAAAPSFAAATTNGAEFAQKLGSLGLTPDQVQGVLALSREVLERVVWEVVPTLAETMIREELQRLTKE